MEDKKTMLTNTAYLLNSWFDGEDGEIWASVKNFLEKHHEEGFRSRKNKFIKVTFEVDEEESESADKTGGKGR